MADRLARAVSKEQLSALADGELAPGEVADVCARWAADGEWQSAWHRYQSIGDVLRSEELASPSGHDAAFMTALRLRLAAEPVVLAPVEPAAVATPLALPRRRFGWAAPALAGAGCWAVASMVWLEWPFQNSPAAAPALVAATDVRPSVGTPPAWPASDPGVFRDPQLDRYLAAHEQLAGRGALGMPSGFLRKAAAEAPSR